MEAVPQTSLETGPLSAAAALHPGRTQDPARIVELLGRVGLGDTDIAAAVGVNERTVRRWRSGQGEGGAPLLRRWRELDDLRAIVLILIEEGTLSTDGIVYWLRARNRALADRRPLEVLAAGGFPEVRCAALAFGGD